MLPDPDKRSPEPPKDNDATAPEKPVDEKAQEEAGKVREESGGYD